MCGIFGFVWTVMVIFYPNASAWFFGTLCLIAFFVASFQIWRKQYREARPYDEETFQHAQAVFDGITEEGKVALEQLAIRKSMERSQILGMLDPTGFVKVDPVLAMYAIDPHYEKIIPRLVKEWRAKNRPLIFQTSRTESVKPPQNRPAS